MKESVLEIKTDSKELFSVRDEEGNVLFSIRNEPSNVSTTIKENENTKLHIKEN